jgi:hypothetical protein
MFKLERLFLVDATSYCCESEALVGPLRNERRTFLLFIIETTFVFLRSLIWSSFVDTIKNTFGADIESKGNFQTPKQAVDAIRQLVGNQCRLMFQLDNLQVRYRNVFCQYFDIARQCKTMKKMHCEEWVF